MCTLTVSQRANSSGSVTSDAQAGGLRVRDVRVVQQDVDVVRAQQLDDPAADQDAERMPTVRR
ncbi:hypothetical protein SVIOM342S_08207 [Streptomyces violaceorubidus]